MTRTDPSKYHKKIPVPPPGYEYSRGYNVDLEDHGCETAIGEFGFGIYKLEIYYDYVVPNTHRDSCLIEFDYYDLSHTPGDLNIEIYGYENDPWGEYQFGNFGIIDLDYNSPAGYKIECWDPDHTQEHKRPKRYGPNINYPDDAFFTYKNESDPDYNHYSWFPLDSRVDCALFPQFGDPQNQLFPFCNFEGGCSPFLDDERQGILTLNLEIEKNVTTPTFFWDSRVTYPAPIIVDTCVKLQIDPGIDFKLLGLDPQFSNRIMDVRRNAFIILQNGLGFGAKIEIFNKNIMILEKDSKICMECGTEWGQSEILVHEDGTFCDYGAIKEGKILIHYLGGNHQVNCRWPDPDHIFNDSTLVLVDSIAVFNIPDSTNLILDGYYTCLKIRPTAIFKFGQNSKLILQNGAHLIADHATFTSLDPNSIWDGIYLNDISNDTITNCTLENAQNGINIKNKYSYTSNQPSTEISNCTFSNTTTTQLTNGIYISASNNILIRNNIFSSTQLIDAFANAILAEYCPSGAFDIVDNNFNKIHNGISIIQSSPYIARNTITGLSSDGDVIYLDNSNGMIKYNNTNYGTHSLNALYSSPYLLKNSFNNASVRGIDIYRNSIPVMHPINSGTTLSWLAGNNLINGNPSSCGIGFQEESYPAMDSGYNKITVNNSDYMNGDIPSVLQANLPASYNYWGEFPVQQKFIVTNGIVIDTPTFDGSTLPPTNYYDLTDIGFGLFDTVFVENLGDNPGDEILFLQAYDKESANQFTQAISLYKQVVQNYLTSTYAPVSLSRIFNCLEKSHGTISDFQMLQAYMNQLRNNTNYPEAVKEIAEDFMIKAKVKQGLINDAISDYQLIYQQNQNNSKGLHALINKECLIAMRPDSNDNPAHGNFASTTEHKLRLLSLILGRNMIPADRVTNGNIPKEFNLYQNYPNPFNPATTIKYDIPKSGEVSIKVYDILGREIYSMNEFKVPGSYSFKFDGSNYASGIYFYRIEAGRFVDAKKMVLIK